MTAIINDISKIKEFIPVNANISEDTVAPFIDAALFEFIEEPWLGDDMIQDIESNMTTSSGIYPDLIPLVQKPLAYFSILKALPFMEVNIGDEGITRTESDNYKTAYRGQVSRIKEQLRTDAYNSLERLLNFLEKNKGTYTQWTSAPGYVENNNYFFKSSKEFSHYYTLRNGRVTYNSLLSSMRYVMEFKIKGEIGTDQYNDFFAKKDSSSNSPEYTEAYRLMKNAIAYYTIALALLEGWVTITDQGVYFYEQKEDIAKETNATDERIIAKNREINSRGNHYLNELVTYMNKNINAFQPFKDDDDIVKVDSDISTGVGQIKGAFGV